MGPSHCDARDNITHIQSQNKKSIHLTDKKFCILLVVVSQVYLYKLLALYTLNFFFMI